MVVSSRGLHLPCSSQESEDQRTTILERHVRSFRVEKLGIFDASLRFGQQEAIPLGIEYVDPDNLWNPVRVNLLHASVRQILEAILAHGKG